MFNEANKDIRHEDSENSHENVKITPVISIGEITKSSSKTISSLIFQKSQKCNDCYKLYEEKK